MHDSYPTPRSPVTIEITAGEDSYEGTEQNDIESLDYGPWGGSFTIVTD